MSQPRTGPSFATTALLGAAVLGLHLGLLANDAVPARAATAATGIESLATGSEAPMNPARQPAPVVVTRVQALPKAPPPTAVATATARPRTPPVPPEAARAPAVAAATLTEPPAAVATSEAATPTDTVLLAQASPAGSAAATRAANLPPSDPPPSITLPYEVQGKARGIDYSAKGALQWQREPTGYEARMELSMPFLGSRVQTSRGAIGPEGLRPERFADRRSSERAAHLDHTARQIRFSNNAPTTTLVPGVQDRLSLFMQLAGLLRARPHKDGDAIEFQVVGTGDAEPWRFDIGPLETLALPAGNIEARRINRAPRKPHDSTVEVWLAPSLGHAPVRLRVTQSNGDMADQRLARLP
jgi:hypothetical protein